MADPLASLRLIKENTKRNPRQNGFEAWLPYYAGFSESWALSTLRALGLRRGARIIDPWNGAGTTTRMASLLGLHCVGYDINPVATIAASAKLAQPSDVMHFEGILDQIVTNANGATSPLNSDDPLRRWLSPSLGASLRALTRSALVLLAKRPDGHVVDPFTEAPPPLASFFLLCLLRAARSVAKFRRSSNPTWHCPATVSRASANTLIAATRACAAKFASDLRNSPALHGSNVELGDARCLPIADSSIDGILTSPPYCTRLDYVVGVQFELAALGIHAHALATLRKASMGTPLTRKLQIETRQFGKKTHRLLQRIRQHDSKDSAGYYYNSHAQYFLDAHTSLSEIRRIARRGAKAVFVLQTSYYKDIPIQLSDLYLDMAREVGLRGERIVRRSVHKVLTDINRGAQNYLAQHKYSEDVIAMEAV